jgi:hypothetical protein
MINELGLKVKEKRYLSNCKRARELAAGNFLKFFCPMRNPLRRQPFKK